MVSQIRYINPVLHRQPEEQIMFRILSVACVVVLGLNGAQSAATTRAHAAHTTAHSTTVGKVTFKFLHFLGYKFLIQKSK